MSPPLDLLPSMPKKMAVDLLVILCIVVLIVFIGLLFFVTDLHKLFVEPVVTPPVTPDRPMNVEVLVPSEASSGESIQMNITLTNLGDQPVEEIVMSVASSPVFEYSELAIDKLLPRKTGQYQLELKIRASASPGESTEKLQVSSKAYTTEENFTIIIK